MTKRTDAEAVRREAVALLRGDIGLTDNLRIDTVATLRMALDNHHERAMAGEKVDLGQLLQAEARLREILPPTRAPDSKQAEHQRHQAAIAPVIAHVRGLHEQIASLTQENTTLRLAVRSALAPAPGAVPAPAPVEAADNVVPMSRPASAAPAPAPAAAGYDYDVERGWRDHVQPDGSISPTPFGGGRKWWGPV
jgi:hypothetical protein